jgi:hypothetical protein
MHLSPNQRGKNAFYPAGILRLQELQPEVTIDSLPSVYVEGVFVLVVEISCSDGHLIPAVRHFRLVTSDHATYPISSCLYRVVLFEHLFPVTAGSVLLVVCAVGPDFNSAKARSGSRLDSSLRSLLNSQL